MQNPLADMEAPQVNINLNAYSSPQFLLLFYLNQIAMFTSIKFVFCCPPEQNVTQCRVHMGTQTHL